MNPKNLELQKKILDYIKANPIKTANGRQLVLEDLQFVEPEALHDVSKQLDMKYSKKGTLDGQLKGRVVIYNNGKIEGKKGPLIKLMTVPFLTDRGTYLVNGIEKKILSQMLLKPGAYTDRKDGGKVTTQITFSKEKDKKYVPQVKFNLDPVNRKFSVEVGNKNFSNGVHFLQGIGFDSHEIKNIMGDSMISNAIFQSQQSQKQKTSSNDVYTAFTGKSIAEKNPELIKMHLDDFLKENARFDTGKDSVKEALGVKDGFSLNKSIIAKSVENTFKALNPDAEIPDKDDLKFKDIYSDTDLLFKNMRLDLDAFFARSKKELESDNKINPSVFTPLRSLDKNLHNFLHGNSADSDIQVPEQLNPIFNAALDKKVTQVGADRSVGARNLFISGVNKVDPIETPESGKIGIVQHFAEGAKIKNGTIHTDFYKVVNGVAEEKNPVEMSIVQELEHKIAYNDTRYVKQEGGKLILAPKVQGRYKGKNVILNRNEIEFVDSEPKNILGVSANAIPFVMHNDGARALMGTNMEKQAVNLPGREAPNVTTVYNAKTGETYDEMLGRKHTSPVYSEIDGTVERIDNSKIYVKGNDGKEHAHNFYHYYPLNQAYMNNEIKVKVGDRVKKGQLIADGWMAKDGKLAQGLNARVGYLPYKGYNYEDGYVVSQSFANRMASEEVEEVDCSVSKSHIGGRNTGALKEILPFTSNKEVLKTLDQDGIIKVGEKVGPGSTLIARLRIIKKDDSFDISKASYQDIVTAHQRGKVTLQYDPYVIPKNSYVEGVVQRINVVNSPDNLTKQNVIITLVNKVPLKQQDKISGRHGNKGTITAILPDHIMPSTPDGKPLDLLISPLGVPSRKNLGQVFEVNAGLLSEKTGKRIAVNNFDHREKDRIMEGLKKIGIPDGKLKVTLHEEDENGNIVHTETENPVTVGQMYVMKLKHKVDEKIQARSNLETPLSQKTHMPLKEVGTAKGEKYNPQRLGEMETRALQGHGAAWNLLESTTIKADGGGDKATKIAIFNALATGQLDSEDLANKSATPETLKVLTHSLKALGLNIKPTQNGRPVELENNTFDSLGITPMSPKEILNFVGEKNEVKNAEQFKARQLFDVKKANRFSSENDILDHAKHEGGLLDPKIFGKEGSEEERKNWGYIKLATPVANPILMSKSSFNPYSAILGIQADKLKKLSIGKQVMIADPATYHINGKPLEKDAVHFFTERMHEAGFKPGELVDVNKAEEKGVLTIVGGEALSLMLSKIDVDTELKKAKEDLNNAKGGAIDSLYKKVRTLQNLKANNLKATDLMMHYVPVTPVYLRKVQVDFSKEGHPIQSNNLTDLYASIIDKNNTIKDNYTVMHGGENHFGIVSYSGDSPLTAANLSASLYNKVSELQGVSQGVKMKNKRKTELQGVLDTLRDKSGLIRGQMLGKRDDFSGRSVIGVDPNLNFDEMGLPIDMAKDLYKPFILKELVDKGFAKDRVEAENKWKVLDNDTKKVIKLIAQDRPIIINRQPSLHKYSLQAFKPIIKDMENGSPVRSIHLNPLVVTGFNADFDGDTMAAHVPISEKAKEEAKELMMPSKNLINPTNGELIIEIRHEMALGTFYLTKNSDKPIGTAKNYGNFDMLKKDYMLGRIPYNQKVNFEDMMGVTAGAALVNSLMPKKYRNTKKPWGKNELTKMLHQMYIDGEREQWKKYTPKDVTIVADKIKKLGFEAATRAGVSIGSSDFKKFDEAHKIIESRIAEAAKKEPDNFKATVAGWREAEKDIEKKIKNGELLDTDNPLNIMMVSGARANAQQIRKMMINVGIGMDVKKNFINPIDKSHFDGLGPGEYYSLGFDSRKGIYDRSVSTEKPGTVTREAWSGVQDVVVTEVDCNTKEGIIVVPNKARGRYLAKDLVGMDGKVIGKRNQMVDDIIINAALKDESIKGVYVRSPLRCKTVHGVCQKCYGAMPGTIQPVKLGTAIGVLASQALGEPVMQMTMNTFHTGGANSSATIGLPKIEAILNVGKDKLGNGVLSTVNGTVDNIEDSPFHTIIHIDGKKHLVKKNYDGTPMELNVKLGDKVEAGHLLTNPDLTSANPHKMLEYREHEVGQDGALNEVRDYLSNSMMDTFKKTLNNDNAIDSRHVETIIGKLTSIVTITDAGDSPFLRGEKVQKNEVDKWNSERVTHPVEMSINDFKAAGRKSAKTLKTKDGKLIVREGQVLSQNELSKLSGLGATTVKVQPFAATYKANLNGKSTIVGKGHDNWVSNLGHEDIGAQIARGATYGQVEKLEDPRARLMTGKLQNIGTGYDAPESIKNTFTSNLLNFFNKDKQKSKKKTF